MFIENFVKSSDVLQLLKRYIKWMDILSFSILSLKKKIYMVNSHLLSFSHISVILYRLGEIQASLLHSGS